MGTQETPITFQDVDLRLLPEGAIFVPERNTLLLADLHLGKAAHFRRNGIPLPPQADEANWFILSRLLDRYPAAEVLFLGDLFHSTYNTDWDNMSELTGHYPAHRFTLIKGNHDILDDSEYAEAGLNVVHEPFDFGPFLLTHHPMETVPEGWYNLAGHLHPGIVLKGKGRQRIRVSCFYFDRQNGILPAFGQFKGRFFLSPDKEARVFAITGDAVIDVSANF